MAIGILTFDLTNPSPGDYDVAYNILQNYGLGALTPNRLGLMPNTTVTGTVAENVTSMLLRDIVRIEFAQAGLNLSALFAVVLRDDDWASYGVVIQDRTTHQQK
jgi:hypothetical protein